MDPLVLGAVIGLVYVTSQGKKAGAGAPTSGGGSSAVGAATGGEAMAGAVTGADVEHAASTPGSQPVQYLDSEGNPVSVTNDGAGPVVTQETGGPGGIGWAGSAPPSGAYAEQVNAGIAGGVAAVLKPSPFENNHGGVNKPSVEPAVIKPGKQSACSCVKAPCACSTPTTTKPAVLTPTMPDSAPTGGIAGAIRPTGFGMPVGSKLPLSSTKPSTKISMPGNPIVVQPSKSTRREVARMLQEHGPAVGAVW